MTGLSRLWDEPLRPSALLTSTSQVVRHDELAGQGGAVADALGDVPAGSLLVWVGRGPTKALVSFIAAQRLGSDFLPVRPDQVTGLISLTKAAGLRLQRQTGDLRIFVPEGTSSPGQRRLMFMTSGTTGTPKVVPFEPSQVSFIVNAIQERLGYRPDDGVFSPIPATFDYGFYQPLLCLVGGADFAFRGTAALPARLLREIQQQSITILPLTPALARSLCACAEQQDVRLETVRMITSTGAHLSEAIIGRLEAVFPKAHVLPMYGMTECKRISIGTAHSRIAGSSGRPLQDTFVSIEGPDGQAVGEGATGSIVVTGPHIAHGYWPAESGDTLIRCGTAWSLHTGDVGFMDATGELHVSGRGASDFVKVRDERVSLVELEERVRQVDGVVEARALAILDGDGLVAHLSIEYTTQSNVVARDDVLAAATQGQRPATLGRIDVIEVKSIDLTPHGKVAR